MRAYSQGKYPDQSRNEDRIVVSDPIYAVLDGTTAKHKAPTTSPGKRAVELIEAVLGELPSKVSARQAVDAIAESLASSTQDGVEPPSASLLAYSAGRNEIWVVGDGWVAIDGRPHRFGHLFEEQNAARRAEVLRTALATSAVQELLATDPGRATILPRLKQEADLANGNDPLSFGRLSHVRVPERFVHVIVPPDDWKRIVLATDGYPDLRPTFEDSEGALRDRIARDPLMIEDPPATKGVAPGQLSFDDRSWLELAN